MIKDSYYTRQERTYDVVERSRAFSQSNRSHSFGLNPMDSRPPITTPRGSLSEQSGGHPIPRMSSDIHSSSNEMSVAFRPHSTQNHPPNLSHNDVKDRDAVLSSVPRTQLDAPPTLPRFHDFFGSIAKGLEPANKLQYTQEPNRDKPSQTEDYDTAFEHLNQPRHGSHAPVLPREPFSQHNPIGPSDLRSYALSSPSKRRRVSQEGVLPNLRNIQGEAKNSSSAELVRLQSTQPLWENRKESSDRGGMHNSSGHSSPIRVSLPSGQRQLPAILPPLDNISRGSGLSPMTPNDSRDHTWSSNYVFGASRPGAQTYPQVSGSFAPPSVAEQYQYEQPRHGYSWSGSSHNSPYQPPGPPQHYSHAPANAYTLPDGRSPFTTGQPHNYTDGYHPNGYHPSPMREQSSTRQRKRRGNLPKETTDKLRSWFMKNLTHPYPSEDQKQEMMRQTGLQMNQISNWFINARRRQLPLLQKNQEAVEERSKTASSGGLLTPTTSLSPRKNRFGVEDAMDTGFEDEDELDEEYPDADDRQPSAPPAMKNHLPHVYQGRRSDLAPLPEQQRGYERSPEQSRGYSTYAPPQLSTLGRERGYTQEKLPGSYN